MRHVAPCAEGARIDPVLTGAATDEPAPGVLPDQDRQRGRAWPAGHRVRFRRVARRDQLAAPRVDRIGEEVAQTAVLPGGDARRAALADGAVLVDRPTGGDR